MRTSEQIISAWRFERERGSLRTALVDIMSDGERWSIDELREAVREDWGSTSDEEIDRQLRGLVLDRIATGSSTDGYELADRLEELA